MFGLFHECFNPLTLHVDTGFDLNNITYKQLLTTLVGLGETIILRNRWYDLATTFTLDEEKLKLILEKNKNKRSNKNIIKGKKFDHQFLPLKKGI